MSGQKRAARATELALFIGVVAVTMLFAVVTRLAWDDWYITYRASKNMALGNGLTFTPGERVHSFTSPLGTLIPGMLSWAVGNTHDDLVLWLYRILGAVLLGLAAIVLWRFAVRQAATRWAPPVLIGAVFLDAKLLANSINGMETAILILFLTATLLLLTERQTWRVAVALGVAWAGLMWSRPDGFVEIAALCIGFLAFPIGGGGWQERGRRLRQFAIAALVMVPIYAPWLIWAQGYYGSFVPHTIVAKGLTRPSLHLDLNSLRFAAGLTYGWPATFMPPYALNFGGWPSVVTLFWRLLGFLAAILWLFPPFRALTRALSLAALVLQAYLTFGMEYAFPWYVPPVTLLSTAALILALDQIAAERRALWFSWRGFPTVARAGGVALLAAVAAMTVIAAAQLRYFQSIIYDRNYRAVGVWLHDHAASPHDTVFLEPLGYISFFSGLKMYDYPGLSSNEVIAARRRHPLRGLGDRAIFADLIPDLKPDWLVLRPNEAGIISAAAPGLLTQTYRPAQTFDVSREVAAVPVLPGRSWFRIDQTFIVYHRVGAPARPPGA